MKDRIKREDNQPGMDQKRQVKNDQYEGTRSSAQSGNQGRADFHPGSTTQGGSNFGQGSHQLAGDTYHQGSTSNRGANYENEAGKFAADDPTGNIAAAKNAASGTPGKQNAGNTERAKLTEERDDIPHGQGAHVNEQESNAKEDYPGIEEIDHNDKDEPERDII